MVPNVFVSSTVTDLHHLRDGVRETLLDLGYNAILSEYGDVGFLPIANAIESCYIALRDCQLAVVILAKRYGHIDRNDLSVTHNEFRTAKEAGIPLITLVDREVLTFYQVYEVNRRADQAFPGMDAPERTFRFLEEIRSSELNNGVLPFVTVTEARSQLKKQIAHLFGDLLRKRFDPVQAQITDVLSEIKTLRHEFSKRNHEISPNVFLRATRFLLNDRTDARLLGKMVESLVGSLDEAVPIMVHAPTFDDFLQSLGLRLDVVDNELKMDRSRMLSHTEWLVSPRSGLEEPEAKGEYVLYSDNRLVMNEVGKRWFDRVYDEFRKGVLERGNPTGR